MGWGVESGCAPLRSATLLDAVVQMWGCVANIGTVLKVKTGIVWAGILDSAAAAAQRRLTSVAVFLAFVHAIAAVASFIFAPELSDSRQGKRRVFFFFTCPPVAARQRLTPNTLARLDVTAELWITSLSAGWWKATCFSLWLRLIWPCPLTPSSSHWSFYFFFRKPLFYQRRRNKAGSENRSPAGAPFTSTAIEKMYPQRCPVPFREKPKPPAFNQKCVLAWRRKLHI